MNKKIEKLLLGFASGVMIAASIWSLIILSINMAESQVGEHSNIGTIGVGPIIVIPQLVVAAIFFYHRPIV